MESEPSTSTSISTSSVQLSQPCRQFEFAEIQVATENFDESLVIGSGGFGKVYKGNILNGSRLVPAAIKRLDSMSNQGAAEFWAEVEMLSQLRHSHLVSLLGYCNHGKEMILVYDYMPNGTLDDHLHKLRTPLSWLHRLKICIGAARGLDYLHTGTGIEVGVIHRDVKTSNILLHESWAAKISDFGLSRIGPTNQPSTYVNTLVKGTFGYMDPNYFITGRLTRKSDVYSFGVVLLEVLCRKRAVDRSLDEEQWGLVTWAQDSIKEGNLKHIIDSDIRVEISPKCLKEFVRIAERCLHSNPKQRHTMAEVVVGLETVLTLQEKVNSSMQAAGKTIFGRMLDMFSAPSNEQSSETREVPADFPNPNLREFDFADLERATGNFSRDMLLGQGGFGNVFLGWVDPKTFAPSKRDIGVAVVVKRLNQAGRQWLAKWLAEVNILGRLAHPNIIRLLGYCIDKNEHLLVYKYMKNRSFDVHLFRSAPDITEPLSWQTRLMIIIGVTRGLAYLHSSNIIYHDVKASNILLDQDFNAKLVDFGFATSGPAITRRVMGTFGYLAPEYFTTGHLTVKSDIYGFGVMLLETLTGKLVSDEQKFLVEWAKPIIAKRSRLKQIMDPHLGQNYPPKAALKCAELAARCLANKPKDRPSSEEVLQTLEQIYVVDE